MKIIILGEKFKLNEKLSKLLSSEINSFHGTEPFLRTANCPAAQKLPNILWNLKVHFHVSVSPPLVPILSQNNPVRTTPSSLSKVHFVRWV
jgi:hypothetical protein